MEQYATDEPEGSTATKSQYMSKKDVKSLVAIMLVLAVVLFPIYQKLRGDGERVMCANNMKAASQAMLTYCDNNNDRFPPVFYPDSEGAPALLDGLPITWVTLVDEGMKPDRTYVCPRSTPEERSKSVPFSGSKPIESSYGMWSGIALQSKGLMEEKPIMIAETVSGSALNAFNPMQMNGGNDGYAIGLDSSNLQGQAINDTVDFGTAKAVTRLAFGDTAKGVFSGKVFGRHEKINHAVDVNGRLIHITSSQALVRTQGQCLIGLWGTR